MASFVRNIRTKYYHNLTIGFQFIDENVGDVFLRHSVYSANLATTGPFWWNLDGWHAASSVRCAPCVLARPVCWHAVLLEDESGGQLATALKER